MHAWSDVGVFPILGMDWRVHRDEWYETLGERLAELQNERAVPWRSHRGQAVYPVVPKLRVEVQLLEWTAQGRARHLSYKGMPASLP